MTANGGSKKRNCSLIGANLGGSGLPTLRVTRLNRDLARGVDASWSHRRRHPAILHWQWAAIRRDHDDVFALLNEDGECVAAWAGKYESAITLAEGAFYRLDFMEVAPGLSGFGLYLWAAIALRGDELGANGVVFGSLAETKQVHLAAGASEPPDVPKDRTVAQELLPLAMWRSGFERHLEAGRELRQP
jgi:hypothetical protein